MRVRVLPAVIGVCLATGCDDESAIPPDHDFRDLPIGVPLDPQTVRVPDDAICSIKVKNHGTKAMETDYLPNVIACEAPGNADLEMLQAQAIAARSYAYFHAQSFGQICNGQGCQVFACGRTPTALHKQAVRDTEGVILSYNDNLTVGFYVAGDKTPNADCSGNSSGVSNTERWVTYNEGKTGTDITQSKIAWRHDPADTDWGQNRGALSQWGAHCLSDKRHFDAPAILRYYYGADIGIHQTVGACVGDTGFDPGESPGDGPTDSCEDVAPDRETIIDNDDDCFELAGPSQYWRTEQAGFGGTLRWTKSTQTSEYNVATWWLQFAESGDYRVQVHIDPDHTTASRAEYEVVDGVRAQSITIDQRPGGWIDLGVFSFEAGAQGQQVRMTDAIGIKGHILQADALRITPADPDACADDSCHADDPGGSVDADRGGAEVGCRIDPQDRGALPLLAMLGLLGVAGGSRRRGATRVRPR